ncbi:MAG: hypothetical protein WAP25_06205 [Ilumatobacteraceae bacterium]
MRKRLLRVCIAGTLVLGVGSWASVSATVPPLDSALTGDEIPDEQGDLVGVPQTTSLINPQATTTIPEGCFPQALPQVVFVGKATNVSDESVSFAIQKTITGDASSYVTGDGTVEVQYGTDAKFVHEGKTYIVGAVTDPFLPILVSKLRATTTTLGAELGQTNTGDACPTFEDAIITLNENGTSVDTGVLRPLRENKLLVIAALVLSVALAIGGLVAVVVMQRTRRGIARTMRRRKLFKQ